MIVEDSALTPYLPWIYSQSGANWHEVTHIKTPPFNTSHAATIKLTLQQHGCQIEQYPDYYILTFPPNTRKKLTEIGRAHV